MQTSNVIVFVDSNVTDYQYLVNNIVSNAQVFVIDSDQDGVIAISEILQQYSNVKGVHILSHGSPGSLRLGSTQLNLDNLDYYASYLESWFNSISSTSLYLYGCEVAAREVGSEFFIPVTASN